MDAPTSFMMNTLGAIAALRGDSCDGFLQTDDGKTFPYHKVLLAACSDYFRALFCGPFTEKCGRPSDVVKVPGREPSTVQAFLDFVYTGIVDLPEACDAESLLSMADHYLVPHLTAQCEGFFLKHLNLMNCFDIYLLSRSYFCPHMQEEALKFIFSCPVHKWPESPGFAKLPFKELHELLNSDNLNARHEERVWYSLVEWIKVDTKNRMKHMTSLMKVFRVALCNFKTLSNIVYQYHLPNFKKAIAAYMEYGWKLRQFDKKRDILSERDLSILEKGSRLLRHRNPKSIIFLTGGWLMSGLTSRIEIFNTSSHTWTESNYAECRRSYHGLVHLNRSVYCLGGFDDSNHVNSVHRFDIDKLEWSKVAGMHTARSFGAYTVTNKSEIFAAGGYDGTKRHRECELYNPSTNSWTSIACMTEKRSGAAACCFEGIIYIAGGCNEQEVLSSVEMYSAVHNQWTTVSHMRTAKTGFGLLSNGVTLIAIGGSDGTKKLKDVEMFDYRLGHWKKVSQMRAPRSNFTAVIINKRIYAIGGFRDFDRKNSVESINLHNLINPKNRWTKGSPLMENRIGIAGCVVKGPMLSQLFNWKKDSKSTC